MSSPIQLAASDDTLKSITIFKSDRAEVTRTFNVTLQSGQNDIAIVGLSSYVDIDSVRVTGLGDARLFEASCKIQKRETWRKSDSSEASDPERIRLLRDKKGLLTQEKNICESATFLLRDYGKTLSGDHVTPADADTFIDQYIARGSTLARTVAKLDEEILQLQREIDDITTKSSINRGETNGRVNVAIMTKMETEVILKLIYVVRQARWNPSYELHAHADESGLPASSVSLHYRATIIQTTGENWRGVALTLSTASPSLADESIPELKPSHISPPHQHLLFPQSTSSSQRTLLRKRAGAPGAPASHTGGQAFGLGRGGAGGLFGQALAPTAFGAFGSSVPQPSTSVVSLEEDAEDEAELVDPPSAFEPATSIAKESPLFISYKIDGESSVPSDGEAHKVSIAEMPFEVTISHVVVPKIKAVVYLEAKVKNTSDYRLMPGPVNVFFDDSLVSKTSVKDIAPGDEFTCTLGPDMGTRIAYKRTSKLEKEAASQFAEQYATIAYTALTTINNTHTFALDKLVVRDGLPISDDGNRVRVILREPSVLAETAQDEQKEVGEHKIAWCSPSGRKDGLYEWQCSLEAGKEITLSSSWDVKAPADVRWIETA